MGVRNGPLSFELSKLQFDGIAVREEIQWLLIIQVDSRRV